MTTLPGSNTLPALRPFRLVYVAGRYRAPTVWGREMNIHQAKLWGVYVTEAGGFPMIPHANTAHFDGLANDQFWLDGTLEMMRRCDAALFIPDWPLSSGARGEHAEALRLGMPILDAGEWRREGLTDAEIITRVRSWLENVTSKAA